MINTVVLTGRLVKDPELAKAKTGTSVCEFTLAVGRTFKQEGQPETDFPRVVCFGKVAENLCQYVAKGSLIGVTGRLQTSTYTDKNGVKQYKTNVAADKIDFLERRKDAPQPQQYNAPYQAGYAPQQVPAQGYQMPYGTQGYGSQPQYGYPDNPPAYSNGGAGIDRKDLPF